MQYHSWVYISGKTIIIRLVTSIKILIKRHISHTCREFDSSWETFHPSLSYVGTNGAHLASASASALWMKKDK